MKTSTLKTALPHCKVVGAIVAPGCHMLTSYSKRVVNGVAHFLILKIQLSGIKCTQLHLNDQCKEVKSVQYKVSKVQQGLVESGAWSRELAGLRAVYSL